MQYVGQTCCKLKRFGEHYHKTETGGPHLTSVLPSLLSYFKHAENVQIELKAFVGLINIIFQLLLKLCI